MIVFMSSAMQEQIEEFADLSRLKYFILLLDQIPKSSWDQIIRNEPEWRYYQGIYEKYGFSRFAVLLMTAALNSYQLKGKAEQKYWKILARYIETNATPSSPRELHQILIGFYQKERLPKGKLKRLERFLQNALVNDIWNSNDMVIEENFQSIWQRLSETMQQKPEAKTICFSMKCLGISLLMNNTFDFDFSCISIPVDSRVESFTKKMKVVQSHTPKMIQTLWSHILWSSQDKNSFLTMIHIDSFIWQIASLNASELKHYLSEFNLDSLYDEFIEFMDYMT